MRVELPKQVAVRFKRALRKSGNREVGGVLMAEQILPSTFRILDFSLDADSGSSTSFVRNPEHHKKALVDFFAKTNGDFSRFNYLGEWHSHPCFPAIPSSVDCQSMLELVDQEKDISFAILLIVRLRYWAFLECSATLFAKNKSMSSISLAMVNA
jgi:[CysO sulfur-carrier protein]-S-L-cysteine hydrolase